MVPERPAAVERLADERELFREDEACALREAEARCERCDVERCEEPCADAREEREAFDGFRPPCVSLLMGNTLSPPPGRTANDPRTWQTCEVFFPLVDWYAHNSRPLPWREPETTPWAILVCEVMSQQTPVARVLPAWQAWLERWPTPADLAATSPAEVLTMWNRLGYPRRALRLRECAQKIVTLHDGKVPCDRDALVALPGVGSYTADAVLAFAFRERSVVLDTNIRRVLARLDGRAYPSASATAAERKRAEALVPAEGERAAQWNAALMELGSLVCTASNPLCEQCPLAEHCAWLEAGCPDNAPRGRGQGYAGTHREARGAVMAVLREAEAPLTRAELLERSRLSESRFEKALASLLADGLAAGEASGYTLPTA